MVILCILLLLLACQPQPSTSMSSTQLPRFAHHFEPESINVAESRDLGVVRGRFRFTADTLRPEKVQAGKFVGVWRRRQGEWQLLLNISNSDQSAP
jgi:hypothetical protein